MQPFCLNQKLREGKKENVTCKYQNKHEQGKQNKTNISEKITISGVGKGDLRKCEQPGGDFQTNFSYF